MDLTLGSASYGRPIFSRKRFTASVVLNRVVGDGEDPTYQNPDSG